MARLLVLMGSGETAPTMARVHRELLGRMGGQVDAVALDTPYGFQENADEIAARTTGFFATHLQCPLEVLRWRSAATPAAEVELALARVREAGYVFAGPGSPTYALGVWSGTALVPTLLELLATRGCVVFASAAAVAVGVATVPVYEIYKVGQQPSWAPGLELLTGATGLPAAVVPHFDNAEGGTHDTRFCYLGARRLAALEAQLPHGAYVLGVDEHTALILDLEGGTAEVVGRGGVTIREGGAGRVVPAGTTIAIDDLRPGVAGAAPTTPAPTPSAPAAPPLLGDAQALEGDFGAALRERRATAAVQAVLDLEALLHDWSADPTQTDEADRARSLLRRMVARLGEVAGAGLGDPRDAVAPLVQAVLAARDAARADGAYAVADGLRDALVDAGVEVRDTADGTEWLWEPARSATG